MLTRQTNWVCFGLMGLAIGVARGDHRHDCSCIVRLAGELQQHGRDLGTEFRGTYRSTPQYWALQSETREIVSRAGHLQVLARGGANLDEMKCDLDSISHCYRHLVQTVRAADASCGPGYPGPAWRHGNVPTRNGQVRRLLECMDKLICQIEEELAKLDVPRNRPGFDPDRRVTGHHGPSGFTVGNPGNHGQTAFSTANGRLTFHFGR